LSRREPLDEAAWALHTAGMATSLVMAREPQVWLESASRPVPGDADQVAAFDTARRGNRNSRCGRSAWVRRAAGIGGETDRRRAYGSSRAPCCTAPWVAFGQVPSPGAQAVMQALHDPADQQRGARISLEPMHVARSARRGSYFCSSRRHAARCPAARVRVARVSDPKDDASERRRYGRAGGREAQRREGRASRANGSTGALLRTRLRERLG
jgi:hypothetical protein